MSDFEPGLNKDAHIALEELYLRSLPNSGFPFRPLSPEVQTRLFKLKYAEYTVSGIGITELGQEAYVAWVDSCQPEKKPMVFE